MRELVVLIATTGRPTLLERTLRSLAECRKPTAYRKTVVVENGGKHRVEDIVAGFTVDLRARYLYSPEPNKSAALNAAIETLDEPLILFTDDDVRCDRELLCAYADAADGIEGGVFFGGPMGVDYEEPPEPWLVPYLPASGTGWAPNQRSGANLLFMGINWAGFAGDIRDAGLFDVERGPGGRSGATGQEMAMQTALREAGGAARYLPDARVWHYVPVERCSPEWVLQRAYRSGMSMGIDRERSHPSRLGSPMWLVGRSARTWVRSVPAWLSFRPRLRFDAELKRAYNRGLRDGLHHARTTPT
jgi:succinoglycan biosynthesis protein ExoM